MKNDVILNFSNRLFTAIIKIILYGMIARSIGVEEFGVFIILISVLTVISQLIICGSEYSIVSSKHGLDYGVLLLFTILKSFVVLIISYLLLFIFFNTFQALTIGIFISSQILYFMFESIYLKFDKYMHFLVLNLLSNSITMVLIIFIELQDAYLPLLIMGGVKVIILLTYSIQYIVHTKLIELKGIHVIYNNSFRFVVFEQLKFLHHRMDIIILSMNGLVISSGYLAAIKNFVEATQYIPKTIQMVLYKYSSKTSSIFKQSYKLLTVFFIIIILLMYYVGPIIIQFIFGNDFKEIHTGLIISLIGAYFYSLAHLNMSSIVIKSEISNILNALISVVYLLNYFVLIILFEYYGAVVAFVISSFLYFILTFLTNKRMNYSLFNQ